MKKNKTVKLIILTCLLFMGSFNYSISQCGTETCDGLDNDHNGYVDEPHLLWQKVIGASYFENYSYMSSTADGGVIIMSYIQDVAYGGDLAATSHGEQDLWILKLDGAGNIQWQRTMGGTLADWPGSIEQTADGGYIFVASSASPVSGDKTIASKGSEDFWLVKLNAMGAIEHQWVYGGSMPDEPLVVHQTADGGYIMGGRSISSDGDKSESIMHGDMWIVKVDALGTIQWENTIGGAIGINDHQWFREIRQTVDGGYIVGMHSTAGIGNDKTEPCFDPYKSWEDLWIVKLDAGGNVVWDNTIGGDHQEGLGAIIQTRDGGFLINATSRSGVSGDKTEPNIGNFSDWIIKLNGSGNILWQKVIGGSAAEIGGAVFEKPNGELLFAGTSASGISGNITEPSIGGYFDEDYWIMKTDDIGNILWQIKMGSNQSDNANSIVPASNYGFFVGGLSYTETAPSCDKPDLGRGAHDLWILKFSGECDECSMTVSAGADAQSYFGYPPQENVTRLASITGGTGPFTYSWTLDRALLTDETMSDPSLSTITVKLIQPAELRVHIVDRNGCIADDAVNISAEDVRCSVSPLKVFVCDKGKTKCLAIPAAQNQILHGAHIGTCASFRSSVTVVDDEVGPSPEFNVFPNPSNGTFTIQMGNIGWDDVEALIKIININGQVVKEQKLQIQPSIKITVDKPGIYLVQLIKGNQVHSKKILITH